MNYSQYKKDLQRIHESEVYGTAVFDMAARLTRNVERKKKWLVLKTLEEKTLERYLAYMQASNQAIVEPTGWQLKGCVEGAALALLPWRMAMKLVADATIAFQENFLRLKQNSEGIHQEFFAYVYAHEKAIEAFAKKELSRDQNSLTAVTNLINNYRSVPKE